MYPTLPDLLETNYVCSHIMSLKVGDNVQKGDADNQQPSSTRDSRKGSETKDYGSDSIVEC